MSRKEALKIYLKVFLVAFVLALALLCLVGAISTLLGYSLDWDKALFGVLWLGLGVGLGVGLVEVLVLRLVDALCFGLVFALGSGLAFGLGDGLAFALGGGLTIGLVSGMTRELTIGLVYGLVLGLVLGLINGLSSGTEVRLTTLLYFFVAYSVVWGLFFFRPFYLLPYLWQYWRGQKRGNSFQAFHNSPVYWDEVIAMPLPRLADWLIRLADIDRACGMQEILFVASKRPYQRKAAQKALVTVLAQDFIRQYHSIENLAKSPAALKSLPVEPDDLPRRKKYLPEGFREVQRRIGAVATLAQDYLTRQTPDGQLQLLIELHSELTAFRDAMKLTPRPVGPEFQAVAASWLEIVNDAETQCRDRLTFTTLHNPFVAGNPLQPRDENIFTGRSDIIAAIEKYILNTGQRPSLLLYGRRRSGKSSTLLNLPRLLSSQFVPVYIDCQDAKWRESDATFCYQLARTIYDELFQRNLTDKIKRPNLEAFEKYAFTKLDEFLDAVENISRQSGKRLLLTFDEYEGLEKGLVRQAITTDVPDKIRNIIQHRERIVVLVSGSHHFNELKEINWASYLINACTLELSYLDEPSSRKLLTEPVPKLQYDDEVVNEIIRLTHCQPYLLQAVAFDLVNYLNEQQRTNATMRDLEAAINKVLVSAGSYFANVWREECSDEERAVLRSLATDAPFEASANREAIHSLCRKEVLETSNEQYRIAIELFRLWILKTETTEPMEFHLPLLLEQFHQPVA